MLLFPWSKRGWGQEIPWKRGWFTACWLWCHVLRWDASWETTVLHQFLFLGQEPILCSWLWVLFFLLEELSFCFGFWVFDFACMLLLRVLDFYFRVSGVCFVLRASRKLSVFAILWCCPDSVLYLNLWFWFLSCASVLESMFLFWGLVFIFGFCGLHFPYLPRYIFNSRISVNLFTGGNLTRLSISWQFRQEKGSIISEFKQVCTYVSAVFFYYYFLVQLKVNLWLRPVDDSQSTRDTLLYQPYRSVSAAIKGLGFCAVLVWKRVWTLIILVWNRVWFLREPRECTNVFLVSIPNEYERKSHANSKFFFVAVLF